MTRRLLHLLVVIHRWIGIVACLYFVIWFFSGAVVMYVGFPRLTTEEKLRSLKPIDWRQVEIHPDIALARMGLRSYPREFRLEMSNGTPMYRAIDWEKNHFAISAVSGAVIHEVTAREAEAIARDFGASPGAAVEATGILWDQWIAFTSKETWSKLGPFHRVALNDPSDRQLYVSGLTGEVVLDTTRRERCWNYFGAVPHFLYFAAIRRDRELWRSVVMAAVLLGSVGAVSGMWLGIRSLRVRKRYPKGRISPFRGWLRWHHVVGVFGGFFVITWLFSGWLSVGPNDWLVQRSLNHAELARYAGHTEPQFDLPSLQPLATQASGARIAQFTWVAGRPLVLLSTTPDDSSVVDARSNALTRLSDAQILDAARRLLPEAQVTRSERLDEGDEYWHSGYTRKPTPILRVRFNDESGTWYHIDPATAQVVALLDETGRASRWLFEAIHDLDFYFLLEHRPLWDIVVLTLLGAGMAISASGLIIGWRRLRSYF